MTATYTLQYGVIIPGYVTVTTLTPNEVTVGSSVIIGSAGAQYNGTHSVYALPQFLPIDVDSFGIIEYDTSYPLANAVMWEDDQTVENLNAIDGTMTFTQTCTWVTGTQILTWLGISVASGDETDFLAQCAAAANAFCFRRRQESGYIDSLTTVPSGDVSLGTIMYGGALYRQRGAIDQFASFSDLGSAPTVGLSPIIKQLLGVSRPQVA